MTRTTRPNLIASICVARDLRPDFLDRERTPVDGPDPDPDPDPEPEVGYGYGYLSL